MSVPIRASPYFSVPWKNDTTISGLHESDFHVHQDPYGIGVVTDQTLKKYEKGRHKSFNRFNSEVEALLKDIPAFKDLPLSK